jgi:energy-coupling factor transporter ATP-binding protein EcfA2
VSTEASRLNPFPGLRSFEPDEDYLFFGRERQVDVLVRRLRTQRFLAVVGASGSGKSSLVRSGLIPSLHGGAMASVGSTWRVAILRPGTDPLGNLARALNTPGVLVREGEDDLAGAFFATNLRASRFGLVHCVRQAQLPAGANVLVLVDQFEELFRFRDDGAAAHAEAVAFVKLLLAGAAARDLPIYVALTLRSDFIGQCMEFAGLPEAVNEGLYLVPRLTRDELRAAITGPVAVGGGAIAPRLVLRLLNDIGDSADHLPILQHALMRTWDRWLADRRSENAEDAPLDLAHYEAIGTMAGALSRHAEEAYGELDPRGQEIAATLFKALTDRGTDGRGIRRPATLAELSALAGADEGAVAAVVERFRQVGRSFLMPPAGTPLAGDTVVDLSHESLMRIWERLVRWTEDEASSARLYLGVARAAARHAEGTSALWRDPELQLALSWREREKPTATWARRYEPSFERAMGFLDASRAARDHEAGEREARRKGELRRARQMVAVLAVASLLTAGFGAFALHQRRTAIEQEQLAEEAMTRETAARQAAEKVLRLARAKSREAEQAMAEAERQSRRADEATALAAEVRRQAGQPTTPAASAPGEPEREASAPSEPAKAAGAPSLTTRVVGLFKKLKGDKKTPPAGGNHGGLPLRAPQRHRTS